MGEETGESVAQQLSWTSRQFKLNSKDETDDEEWDDYRENKKDYTGLKIENLVVEEPAVKPEEEDTEVNENGEIVKKEESGPWNKKEAERTNSGEMKEDSPVAETTVMPGTGEPMPGV